MRAGLVLALALAATPALAQTPGPDAFVRSLYGQYFDPKAALDEGNVYEPKLAALMRKASETGDLGADPICACQDYDFRTVDVVVRSADAKAATVEARFINFDAPRTVTFSLVMTPKGWRVSDIASADAPSLRAALR